MTREMIAVIVKAGLMALLEKTDAELRDLEPWLTKQHIRIALKDPCPKNPDDEHAMDIIRRAAESIDEEADRARHLIAVCLDELGDPHPTLDWKAITKLTGDDFIEKMIQRVSIRLQRILGPDMVSQRDGRWFFHHPGWAAQSRGYPTEAEARAALDRYIDHLDQEPPQGKGE